MKIKTFTEFVNENSLEEGVKVEDGNYQGAHGKKPSGKGNWMFSKQKSHDFGKHANEDLFNYQGTYSDAKKAAVKYFQEKGVSGTIYTQT